MRVRIWLHTIQVEDEGDGVGRAEPFLWPLFFRLDARTLTHLSEPPGALAESPVWLVAPDGAHRNLGGAYRTGETITIPAPLGRVIFELDPAGLLTNQQARAGYLVALLEEDIFPGDAAIIREYARFAMGIERTLRDRLRAELSDAQIAVFGLERPESSPGDAAIAELAARDIQETLSHWRIGGDDLVGVRAEAWSLDELEARPSRTISARWAAPEGSKGGAYLLEGEVQAEVAAEGAPAGLVWAVDRSPQVYFRSEGRHVHRLSYDGSGWNHQDLFHLARNAERALPPAAASDPVCPASAPDHAQHVIYRGMDDHLHELTLRGGWRHLDLSAEARAPQAAGTPSTWTRPADGSRHVAFRGRDGHVHELWHRERWHHHDLTLAAPGAPNALGDPTAFVHHASGQQAIAFRGADGHLHVLAFDGQRWRHDDLGFSARAPAAASDPVVIADEAAGLLALVYRSALSHVILLVHEADTWRPLDLSEIAHAPPAVGRPSACLSDGAIFVAWRGLDGRVHSLLGEGNGWQHEYLSQITRCAARASSDPAAFAGGRDKSLHVAFRGDDRHVHAISHLDGWSHLDLSLAARIGFGP